MIVKTEEKNGIKIYTVSPKLTNDQMAARLNTYVRPSDITDIIRHSCDIYNEAGVLLMRFRKKALSTQNATLFYENVQEFAHKISTNRGSVTGGVTGKRNVRNNQPTMTNIFGFFDRWGPRQKYMFNQTGIHPPTEVRECWFNMNHPEKYQRAIPLIQEISTLYKKLAPTHFKKQNDKAKTTEFRIGKTAFTTITTNLNFQTTIHRDRGDDEEGFGNLVVFENGAYAGGETCFPQYGIGVDVRQLDILFMNVHEPHGNLPLRLKNKQSERLSIVCYLRRGVWEKTKNKPGMLNRTRKLMQRVYKAGKKTQKRMKTGETD